MRQLQRSDDKSPGSTVGDAKVCSRTTDKTGQYSAIDMQHWAFVDYGLARSPALLSGPSPRKVQNQKCQVNKVQAKMSNLLI
jgi:hypothetical protein